MVMPGRSWESTKYRFGAQGSEVDEEINGTRNTISTFYREGDLRRLQWYTPDPKAKPWESPYVMMGNNPIRNADPLGDDWIKKAGTGQWEWHASITSEAQAKAEFGPNTSYGAPGHTYFSTVDSKEVMLLANNKWQYTGQVGVDPNCWQGGNNNIVQSTGNTAGGAFADAFAKGFAGGLAAGAAIFSLPAITVSATSWALKGGISAFAQGLINKKVNLFSTAVDAFTVPGLSSSVAGSVADVNVGLQGFETPRLVGVNKSLSEFVVDVTTTLTFGKLNKFNSKNMLDVTGEKMMSEIMTSVPGSLFGNQINDLTKKELSKQK
jgi:hypothetical protein